MLNVTPAAKRRRRAEDATAVLKRPFRSPTVRLAAKEEDVRWRKTPAAAAKEPVSEMADLVAQFERDLEAGDRTIQHMSKTSLDKMAHANVDQLHQPGSNSSNGGSTAGKSNESGKGPDVDGELPVLISRWRSAGRMAADEVFALVSERVARAGGVKAWRATALVSQPFIDDEDRWRHRSNDDAGASDGIDEERDGRVSPADAEQEEEEQEFTMATMLASLHVDPNILGYDAEEERWKD